MPGLATLTAEPGFLKRSAALRRSLVIGLAAFLTVVDLFAAQAILPSLVAEYRVTPAAMGVAVNASTFGMAISGLAVALFSQRIDRRRGVFLSLAILSVPTALLALAPDLATFTALRVLQGIFMAAAFTLSLAYLAERCSAAEAASASAAYITGNVASNLFGRLLSASVADHFGLDANFYLFALLNLAGAVLVYFSLAGTPPMAGAASMKQDAGAWREHFRDARMRASFAIGFLILFAFIGTFTYVNFVLVRAPISLSPMALGFVYLVFLPSMVTTPLAGRLAATIGPRPSFWAAMALAGVGLPLLLSETLPPLLAGLALLGIGTFFGQAVATAYVGRAARGDRGSASGLYLASYYGGGLAGSAVLGQVFQTFGWGACLAGIGLALGLAALLARRMTASAAL